MPSIAVSKLLGIDLTELESWNCCIGLTKISQGVKRQLASIKAVPYYGCQHAGFPKSAPFDDPQRPQTLSKLIAALGAEPVAFPDATKCCGGPLS